MTCCLNKGFIWPQDKYKSMANALGSSGQIQDAARDVQGRCRCMAKKGQMEASITNCS